MTTLELFIIAVGVSMDAFAVSICKGLSAPAAGGRERAITGLYFGGFQALMPLIGYLLGSRFSHIITAYDHWVAFVLLLILGGRMIREALGDCCEEETLNAAFDFKTMLPLAVATSIDALAVGITFAFLQVNILQAVAFIGATTFLFSAVGVRLGQVFGVRYKSKAELAGGAILILMGCKILAEHLGLL